MCALVGRSFVAAIASAILGTWALAEDSLRVAWFTELGPVPRTALKAEAQRLGTIVGRGLPVEVLSR